MTLYFVEHTDPYLQSFYLFTAEKKPGYGDYHMCIGIDRKTMYLKDYNGETGIRLHKRFVKDVIDIDVLPVEELFGDVKMYKRFEFSINLIKKNLGG